MGTAFTREELMSDTLWHIREDLQEQRAILQRLGYPYLKWLQKQGLLFRTRKEARDICNSIRGFLGMQKITTPCEELDMSLLSKEKQKDNTQLSPRKFPCSASLPADRNQTNADCDTLQVHISRTHDDHTSLDFQVNLIRKK